MSNNPFQAAPFFTLRVPMWAFEDYEQILAQENWAEALIELYKTDKTLREAIALASPSLHHSLQQSPLQDPEKLCFSLLNYVIRMSTRATPFGLFSFVRNGVWGQETDSSFDLSQVKRHPRPDLELVFAETCRNEKIAVWANPLVRLRRNRYELNYIMGDGAPKAASIRASELVKHIFGLAKEPITIDELLKCFEKKTLGVINTLLEHQFLLPASLPSLLDDFEVGEKGQIDAVYKDGDFHLKKSVAEEVEKALSILWKISADCSYVSPLKGYLEKFIEKYGSYRTVPLLELLSVMGPYPKNQEKASLAEPWERWLSQQWQSCLRENKQEILLTERDVDSLAIPTNGPLSLDVFCKVFAASSKHLDQGEFLILLTQINLMGGSSLGRFLPALQGKVQSELEEFFRKEEALEPDATFVEISYWPASPHFANIAAHPCLRAMRLDLGEKKRGPNSLALADIYVGVTDNRFYLTLKEGGSEIIPRAGNRLNPDMAPDPIRFMHEVGRARHRPLYPFSFGKLEETAVFLPRVRFQKVILSPARWKLDGACFLNEQKEQIIAAFSAWAEKWSLPDRIFLVREDQYLLLDRRHPGQLNEVVQKLQRGESLQFIEEDGQAWMQSERGRHLCEIVIPFLKNQLYTKKRIATRPFLSIPDEERWKFPGSEWLYVKFYLDDEGMDHFLIHHLAPFANDLSAVGWYFVRYGDPDRHIRFRVKFPSKTAALSLLEKATMTWIKEGLIKNMVIASYEREIERYGGLGLIDQAEEVFFADTESVIQQLHSPLSKTIGWEAVSVISFLKSFNLNSDEMLTLLDGRERSLLQGFRAQKGRLLQMAEQIEILKISCSFPLEVVNSLLHMHCNRLGCNEEKARLWACNLLLHIEKMPNYSYNF